MTMKLSKKGYKFLGREEGLRLKAYRDMKGVPTIGYGNTFYEDGSPVQMGDEITKERAEQLFSLITGRFEKGVNEMVTRELNRNQFDALVSLAYNIGLNAFKRSTVLRRVNANPCDPAIRDAFHMWQNSGANRGILLPRRKREADLYFS